MGPQLLLWRGVFGQDPDAAGASACPGGVVLFGRNLDPDPAAGPARCAALVRGLQAARGRSEPLAVAMDQEGGPVSRLRPWVGPTPPLRAVWRAFGTAGCRRWGELWGRGLALLGCNVDFAPVADLWDPAGTALGDRAADADPAQAARAAGAFLHGLEGAGVRGCLKHFPGLGGTALDSHLGLPVLADPERIRRNALPFRMLAHPDRLVMVAHLALPDGHGLPASLHRGLVADNPWRVQARWLPDDLEMGGCAGWSWDDRVRGCLEAGHQALLVCQTPEGVDACARAAEALQENLWRPAVERFLGFRRELPEGPGRFDPGAWLAWGEEVRKAAGSVLARVDS
jgi:beta-N-acetylhexosaminidase